MDRTGLSAYEAFLAVADSGGFGAAARELGLTQSTVSRRVARLEARLGVRLIARTTRQVTLTEAGERFLAEIRDSLTRLQNAETTISRGDQDITGLVRITMPSAFGRQEVMPVIAKLSIKYPQLRFDLDLSDRYVDLRSARFDLAVRFSDEAPSGWSCLTLGDVHARICATPTYLAKAGVPVNSAALLEHRLLAMQTYSPRTTWTLFENHRTIKIEIAPAILVSDFAAVLALTLANSGIAALPSYLADPFIATGALIEVLPNFLRLVTKPHLMIPNHLTKVGRICRVVEALRTGGDSCDGKDRVHTAGGPAAMERGTQGRFEAGAEAAAGVGGPLFPRPQPTTS